MLKLIGRLLLFLPIFLGMMFVSYRVDPSGLFWGAGFERLASEYMLQGIYIDGYERLDGRALNEVYAKNVPQAPDILDKLLWLRPRSGYSDRFDSLY